MVQRDTDTTAPNPMATPAKARVLFLPTPGVGHFIPMVEAAKLLLRRESRLSATVLTLHNPNSASSSSSSSSVATTVSSYIASTTSTTTLDLSFHHLPPPAAPPCPAAHQGEAFLSLLVDSSKTHIRTAISRYHSAAAPVSAIVVDLFATSIFDVAAEFGIPAYVYFASSAAMLGLMLYLPNLPLVFDGASINFPGFASPLPVDHIPSACLNKSGEGYQWLLRHGRRFQEAAGIILNSFPELEPGPHAALDAGHYLPKHSTPPIYPIGPILTQNPESPAAQCLRWLDANPTNSVVFLCFGSLFSLQTHQTLEIAAALENARFRFLWVLKDETLPHEFEERTKGQGMVLREWAPQVEVLKHRAVGCFVTHCGWNSCVEAAWCGVPMVAWPVQAEQHLNGFEMAREVGVAVEVRGGRRGGGVVGREEVEGCLKETMEGDGGPRRRAEGVMWASRKAVEDKGSSHEAVGRLVRRLCPSSASTDSS